MATIPPFSTIEYLLNTHQSISLLNTSLRNYKKWSFGNPDNFLLNFNGIKSNWDQFKSKPIPGLETRCNNIDIELENTQRKLEIILGRSLSQTSTTVQPTPLQHTIPHLPSEYVNAEHAFQAQKFTDKPNDNEIGGGGRVDVMMNAFRTKLGQNPNLEKLLMATTTVPHISQSAEQQRWLEDIAQRAKTVRYIAFNDCHSDEPRACFGSFYNCRLEFGGRHYFSAESAFLAQLYTDQPHVMEKFEKTDAYAAQRLFRENFVTPVLFEQWENLNIPNVNKVDIMMQVLRAKFDQNPHLKELLMATGDAYLVEHLNNLAREEKFWSDGFYGNGTNMMGICLMTLRKEYGGTGVVPPHQNYTALIGSTHFF